MKEQRLTKLLLLGATIGALLLSACSLLESASDSTPEADEAIAAAVQDYMAEQGGPFEQVEVEIEQLEGDYARVQIVSTDPAEPGGLTGFLQRSGGDWMVLITGSGFNPDEVQALGIPESIVPEGWVFSAEEPAAGEPAVAAGCPEAGADTLAWSDDERGFCLLYPASHTVIELDSGNTEFVVGELMNHIDPRISVTSQDLAGRTLAQAVDDFLAGYEGFEIARSDLMVDGQEAVMLDGVPGQDYYRVLFVAHNGLLYRLDVAPYDANLDNLAQAEQLYALAMESFHFTTP